MSQGAIHIKKKFFHDDMNDGNENRWSEAGDVDWTSTDYVELGAGMQIVTVTRYLYKILAFDIYADDWTDIYAGFGLSNYSDDQIQFDTDAFISTSNDITDASTAITLTNETWYRMIITWCPQFVSIQIYEHDGTLAAYVKHRNPPSRRLSLLFGVDGGSGATMRLANVSVQEGDDAQFFLSKRDHITMDRTPLGGASWVNHDYYAAILMNATGRAMLTSGSSRAGQSRFRIRYYFFNRDGAQTIDLFVGHNICTAGANLIINNRLVSLPNGYSCYTTEWIPLNGLPNKIGSLVQTNTNNRLYNYEAQVELE